MRMKEKETEIQKIKKQENEDNNRRDETGGWEKRGT